MSHTMSVKKHNPAQRQWPGGCPAGAPTETRCGDMRSVDQLAGGPGGGGAWGSADKPLH